ncbi:MAG: hypothetical protein DHS20C14_06380 [Phycisphaeraceae bacterium]|nr:MAG: hypothetical protein DHS20C14_06380 [Phycisphaeraceae bacterium]
MLGVVGEPHTPSCARCGYDLSGIADAWTDACPLRGICPECGHDFAWGNVFDMSRTDLPWLIEHAKGRREWVGRVIPTLRHACCPRSYWRDVTVDARVRLVPLIAFVAVVWLVPYLVSGAVFAQERAAFLTANRYGGPSDLQFAHAVAASAAVHPVATTWRFTSPWTRVEWQRRGVIVVFALAMHTTWPVMMLILPVTRRRARVRLAHVARAWITGFIAALPAWVIAMGLAHVDQRWSRFMFPSWYREPGVLLWILVPFIAWWWWCVVRVGWRVEQAGRVFWALCLCSVVAAVVSVLAIDLDVFATLWWLIQ